MVRTGLMRTFGAALRRALVKYSRRRLGAFGVGLGVTALTQSSSATAVIVSSFVGRGVLSLAPALAIMLGADVGTTLVAQVLSFGLAWLSPLLIFAGFVLFSSVASGRWHHFGRVVIGLGLLLLSLQVIGTASAPLRDSGAVALFVGPLAGEPVLAVAFAAGLAWLMHSSLAAVLLVMSIAANGLLPLPVALTLVVGANIGGGIVPVALTAGSGVTGRRLPWANLAMKAAFGLALLPLLPYAADYLAVLGADPARQVANLHTGFNIALAAVFLPLVGWIAKGCVRVMPAPPAADEPGKPRYLDADALETPSVALANASREALRMGDAIAGMLGRTIEVFRKGDAKLASAIEREDDVVDQLNEAIKLYLTRLTQGELDPAEGRRCTEILAFTTNLEHVGDIIDRNLMELAAKKIKSRITFSEQGFAEIAAFHARIAENLQLALNVFVSGDPRLARRLLNEKVAVRDAELAAAESHLARLRAGRPESIESSGLHLDVIRDLKRINSHLTAVAYPILEATGELRESRLREAAE